MHEKTNVFFHIVKYEDRKRLGNKRTVFNHYVVVILSIALSQFDKLDVKLLSGTIFTYPAAQCLLNIVWLSE